MKRAFKLLTWLLPLLSLAAATPRDVTFLVTSDAHYAAFENEDRNDRDHATVLKMNAIATESWPTKLGGGAIAKPRGVLLLGDVINDGDRRVTGQNQSAAEYGHFLADFGLDGTDGVLQFPVFEGWGNHDGSPAGKEKHGFSFQARLKERNRLRKEKRLIAHLSANELHYSWDWDDVHFVQLNLYPADKQNPAVPYSPVWHDPQGALTFLKQDLAQNVGTSGRPVVLVSHCGFDTDWWNAADWNAAYDAAKSYNVILYFYGHSGTGLRQWAPAGATRKWDCVNTGQTEKGFFVVQITGERARLAYRIKNLKEIKGTDGKPHSVWDGTWVWKYPLEKAITTAP